MFNETDWSQSNGQLFQYKLFQHIHIDFFNIIQPAWDTEWLIAGDEAYNNDIFTGENVS